LSGGIGFVNLMKLVTLQKEDSKVSRNISKFFKCVEFGHISNSGKGKGKAVPLQA
jgi:hypothetical protein